MSPLISSLRFLQTQSDARLAALAGAGHEAAFEALVRRYHKQLLRYCVRIVGSSSAAEDVLQQALLAAWIAIRRGTSVNDVRPWLYRIVHNASVSSLRQGSARLEVPDDTAARHSTDHEVQQRFEARAALAGLAALPELQREVMLSTVIDGRSHDEVATALGLTSGAVRGLVYRARSTLRAAAAALIPSPVISWAARHASAHGARTSTMLEAIGAGGSAGVGGVLLKGGIVIASAGAIAAAGITATHSRHLRPHTRPGSAVVARAAEPARPTRAAAADVVPGPSGSVRAHVGPAARGRSQARDASSSERVGRSGERGDRSPGDGARGGASGGSSGGSDGGASGGSDGGSTSGGSDRGSTSSGSDGGSRGGSDGGSTTSGGSTSGGSDGGSTSGGSDGGTTTSGGSTSGGSDGGTTTDGGSTSGG